MRVLFLCGLLVPVAQAHARNSTCRRCVFQGNSHEHSKRNTYGLGRLEYDLN